MAWLASSHDVRIEPQHHWLGVYLEDPEDPTHRT